MPTSYTCYTLDDEVYDPATVRVGDYVHADGQEWVVEVVGPDRVEVGCAGCQATRFAGWRINQHGKVERCDACETFESDDEAIEAARRRAAAGTQRQGVMIRFDSSESHHARVGGADSVEVGPFGYADLMYEILRVDDGDTVAVNTGDWVVEVRAPGNSDPLRELAKHNGDRFSDVTIYACGS